MNIPSGCVGVSIPDTDFSVEIDPENGHLKVWNGGNGSGYEIEELAPFTDE